MKTPSQDSSRTGNRSQESSNVANWFLKRMEGNVQTEVGPLRPSELLKLVRTGQIKPNTQLRKDDSAWFEAKEVGGLFEAAVKRETRYYCPSCNKSISRPPVTCGHCLRDIDTHEAREVSADEMSAKASNQLAETSRADEGKKSVQSWLKNRVKKR